MDSNNTIRQQDALLNDGLPNPVLPRIPILELTDAEIAYFEQTRRECDTEKAQKDKVLQYAFLVSGATSVFGLTKLDVATIESSWSSLLLSFSLLIIIIALMGWRRQKLRAQGYRWVVLQSLIASGIRKEHDWKSLEFVILNGVKKNIHGRDDGLFMFGLSMPIVCLIAWHSYKLFVTYHQHFALVISGVSLLLFVWAMIRQSKPTSREYGLREIVKQTENVTT